jgi:hypothetical protein
MKAEKYREFLEYWKPEYSEKIKSIFYELSELERLAEIGKATEKAFEEQYIEFVGEGDYNPNAVSDLLSWYREQATT